MSYVKSTLSYDQYEIRRQFFKVFGGAYRIYDPTGQLVFYAHQKAFRLREDIRLYTDESMQTEAVLIKTRHIIDWSAAYDVIDAPSETKIRALKRRGLRSMVRDEWVIMDAEDQEIGRVREDSVLLGLVRRLVTNLVPQSYDVEMGGVTVGTFKQNFNPFLLKLRADFSAGVQHMLDRRLALAAGVLLCAIEGRQS